MSSFSTLVYSSLSLNREFFAVKETKEGLEGRML